MATLLQLTKKRDDALAAVVGAKSESVRASALSEFEHAALALASFRSRLESKSTTFVKKEERYEEEDDSDDEDEEEEEKADDEPKKPLMKKSSKSEKEEEKEDEDEEDEEEEEEEEEDEDSTDSTGSSESSDSSDSGSSEGEKAQALLSAKTGLYTYDRLYRLACSLTGKANPREVFGALDAIGLRLKAAAQLEKRVNKLESKGRAERVDALIKQARRDGKITSAAVPSLRAKGLNDPKWLRAHLDVLPARVRTLEDGALEGAAEEGVVEERNAKLLSAQNMPPEQRKMIETMAAGSGKSFDDFVAEMNKLTAAAGSRSAR